ncbi:MAG: DegT/DnrJ/EryC1/StrS family aminotransferase [Phycisphaerae bacterium]|nr:DegT/DnrJ/EryC1/StrS family aminotransferase [Phycisphaerae bacterium]
MSGEAISRRTFMAAASVGAMGMACPAGTAFSATVAGTARPALLGGPRIRTRPFPGWPVWDPEAEEHVLSILRSGNWFRGSGNTVTQFEKAYAELLGAKRALCVVNGTNALLTALHMLDVGVGDEVIVSPYTFIATYNVVLQSCALPVFADTDPATMQIDPNKIEARITERTRAILPVHILGQPANLDRILAIAKKHNLVVIEDACQAWLGEWRGRKLGTVGDLGCFSFQNSKHLPCGEGGAVVGNDDDLMDRAHAFHNCGRAYGGMKATSGYPIVGTNRRMTEYQAAILLSQMKRLVADTARRRENAAYLDARLKDIPGILPQKIYEGGRGAYHLYAFRVKPQALGLSRGRFMEALRAEGIPCSGGYGPQYKDGLIEDALNSKNFKRSFPAERLKSYREELVYPENDRLCTEAVWFTQNLLLGTKQDMDDIANAVTKVYENRDKLA